MAVYGIQIPGDGTTPFVTEKEACEFLKVSDDALDRAAERLDWLHPRKMGKSIVYDPVEIGLLAEAIKKNMVDPEVFSRLLERPEAPATAQDRLRPPGKKDANPGSGQA